MITWDTTERGFKIGRWEDTYEQDCSIQISSLATDDRIWLGVVNNLEAFEDSPPEVIMKGGSRYVHRNARMHLDREQASELAKILQHFADNGTI